MAEHRTQTLVVPILTAALGFAGGTYWGPILKDSAVQRWYYHIAGSVPVEAGYGCRSNSDCASEVCRLAPESALSFCTADLDCAYPGRSGYSLSERIPFKGHTYRCAAIRSASPRWTLDD